MGFSAMITAAMDCCHSCEQMHFQADRQSFRNALCSSTYGVVFQLTMNVNRVLLFEIFFPTWWGSLYIHLILTHCHNNCDRHTQFLFDAYQVASCLQAAKQHSRLRCRATNETRVERPGSNGVELVIVIPRHYIQCRPGLGVIISLLDILLPSLRPSSQREGRHDCRNERVSDGTTNCRATAKQTQQIAFTQQLHKSCDSTCHIFRNNKNMFMHTENIAKHTSEYIQQ